MVQSPAIVSRGPESVDVWLNNQSSVDSDCVHRKGCGREIACYGDLCNRVS